MLLRMERSTLSKQEDKGDSFAPVRSVAASV
jgi:hypothetical protein